MRRSRESRGETRRFGHMARFFIRALSLLAIVAILVAFLAPLIAETLIVDTIEARGLGPVKVDVESVGLNRMVVSALSIDDPAAETKLSIEGASVEYTPFELIHGRLQAVDMDHLTVHGRVDATGLNFGALERLWARDPEAAEAAFDLADLPEVGIDQLDFNLATPLGGVRSTVSAVLTLRDDGKSLNCEIQGGTISAEAFGASLEELAASGSVSMDPASILLELDSLTGRAVDREQRFAAAHVNLSARGTEHVFRAQGALSDVKGRPIAALQAHYDLTQGEGEIRFDTGALRFEPRGLQPQVLVPVLQQIISNVSGLMELEGSISWGSSEILESGALLQITGLAGTNPLAQFSDVSGTIQFDSLLPLTSKPEQELSIGQLDLGLSFQDGTVKVRFVPERRLKISELTFPWSGGRLNVTETVWSMGEPLPDVTLVVENVALSEFFDMLDVEGLSGTGRVNGHLPITVEDGKAFVRQGRIVAPSGGLLRYTGGAASAVGEQGEIVFQALKDFHYDSLSIDIDGELNGDMIVRVALHGANPSLFDGYPIELNVSVESELVELLKQGIASAQVFEVIREQAAP